MSTRTPTLVKVTACLGAAVAIGASALRAAPSPPTTPGVAAVARQDDQVVDRVARSDMRAGSSKVRLAQRSIPKATSAVVAAR